ncbi:hypothetical protein DFH11DRAFT_1544619 [Phellopilus nigrolimitatus]|nr:hypothetical protein DFH11DRAFT_1544619 [Phellopilus nigrolimitatus]
MSTRSFTVFQDEPSAPSIPKAPLERSASTVLRGPRGSLNIPVLSTPFVPLLEKENIHPVTGLGTGPATASKKRKASESGSVLATKVLAVTAVTAAGPSKPKRAELKRKASAVTTTGKTKSKAKKGSESKKVNSSSDITPSPTQKTPSLSLSRSSPKTLETVEEVPEEDTVSEKPTKAPKLLTQASIDARCYELTVSPLADVTDAYLQSSDKKVEEMKDEDLPEYRLVQEESSFATKIRDYFSWEGSRSNSMSSLQSSSSAATSFFFSSDELEARSSGFSAFQSEDDGSAEGTVVPVTPKKGLVRSTSLPSTPKETEEARESVGSAMLSTPERKELYALFTFTTPKSSPTKFK